MIFDVQNTKHSKVTIRDADGQPITAIVPFWYCTETRKVKGYLRSGSDEPGHRVVTIKGNGRNREVLQVCAVLEGSTIEVDGVVY